MDAAADRMETRATRVLGIRYPIVQGGLARVARAELAAAVSQAGGLGQIAMAGLHQPDLLRAEIRKARALTSAPFAVNFPIGRIDISALVDLSVEEGVPVLSFTAGNPRPWIDRLAGTGTRTLVLVAGAEQARKAEQAGADVVATVGYEGGGHLGRSDLTTMVAVPMVVDAVGIPVLASGGIVDGRGLAAALALGADGIELGTRFVATREAAAHERYKAALLAAQPEDTLVIKQSLGMPGRVLDSAWTRRIQAAEKAGADRDSVLAMVDWAANERAAVGGELDDGLVWAGQAVGLIDDLPPAGEVVARIVAGARAAAGRAAALTGAQGEG